MILLIATMKVAPENRESFEAIMSELAATVREREPGVPFYQLGRSQADATTYRMMELYESQEAFDSHMKTEWFQGAWPKFGALLSEPPTLEKLDAVG